MKKDIDDFDDFAEDYREVHAQNIKLSGADSFYFAEMKVRLLQQFEKNIALNILDMGCGDGTTEMFMHQYFSRWKIEGIDISKKSIDVAKSKKIDGATFSIYNGTNIPFTDESFDIVFMAGVLHHVNFNMHQTLTKEIYRVLKKNGRLYLFEHNPLNPVTRHLVNTCVFDKNVHLLNNSYAKKMLRANNFIVNSNQFIIFFPRKNFFKKLLHVEKFLKWLPLGGQYFVRAIKS